MKKSLLFVVVFAVSGAAYADSNFIDEKDAGVLWPINAKTQKIPKFKDPKTGWLLGGSEKEIDEANDKYTPDQRQVVIDECRMEALRKKTQLVDKQGVIKRLKDKNDGLIVELQQQFMYCTQAMLKQWREEDAQEEKDQKK